MAALNLVTLLVRNYDEAIDYFCDKLDFKLLEDTELSPDKRWVVVGSAGASLLLAKAATPEQTAQIGNAAGGRVAYFLYSENFDETYLRFRAHGVNFLETPRHESYGKVVQFADLYDNKWDLIEALNS